MRQISAADRNEQSLISPQRPAEGDRPIRNPLGIILVFRKVSRACAITCDVFFYYSKSYFPNSLSRCEHFFLLLCQQVAIVKKDNNFIQDTNIIMIIFC